MNTTLKFLIVGGGGGGGGRGGVGGQTYEGLEISVNSIIEATQFLL